MKRIILIVLLCSFKISQAQNVIVAQGTDAEYCPNVDYEFTCSTLTNISSVSVSPVRISSNDGIPQNAMILDNGFISNAGQYKVFRFRGRFSDDGLNQAFRFNFSNGTTQYPESDVVFKRIKSFGSSGVKSKPILSLSTIQVPRCEIQSIPISFAPVKFLNPNDDNVEFGSVSSFEYLLPTGWQINGTTSTGGWISGNTSATITSDLSNGDNGVIRIRAVNPCNGFLKPGTEAVISIARPAPTFSITGSSNNLCNGSISFSLNGLPSGASISWSSSNSSIASVPANSNQPQVILSRIPGGQSGLIDLTALITHCAFSYTVSRQVQVGGPGEGQFSIFTNSSQSPYCPNVPIMFGANFINTQYRCGSVPGGLTNVEWEVTPFSATVMENTGMAICPSDNNAGISVIFQNQYYPYTAQVRARGQNNCGYGNWTAWLPVSIQSGTNCGGGFSSFSVSPNPSLGRITISKKDQVNGQEGAIYQVLIFDRIGNLVRKIRFAKGVSRTDINISDLKSDIYFMKIFYGKGWTYEKLIKQ
ncbi:T9SS type A sorting domain-containing protein [Parasegetibacter sp. NRK P23]|uniref:T9SS type A sorting domain-containing protein n=1 Tax=Parasegetibacter sp. NRK P23 TaxID=2942999 RepID=UPI0020447FB4|nr:T9SS type A sorting domain-containing protein [Parasegetibacter sp. NRK P23]MCM5527709.1 T9SS type A sorting domain-containing protein [Parasegetibacter sp. NRK P23]